METTRLEEISNRKITKGRKVEVRAFIEFTLMKESALSVDYPHYFSDLILRIDEESPWISHNEDGDLLRSVNILDKGARNYQIAYMDPVWIVTIAPAPLKLEQLYAYNQYLRRLTERIAKEVYADIRMVESWLELGKVGESSAFLTPIEKKRPVQPKGHRHYAGAGMH